MENSLLELTGDGLDDYQLSLGRRDYKAENKLVTLAVDYAAVCGTDRQIILGMRERMTTVIGHEAIATVVSSKDTVFSPGDRVVLNPTPAVCPQQQIGHNRAGVWQKYIGLSAEDVQNGLAIKLDILQNRNKIEPRMALVEPLSTVLYGIEITKSVPLDIQAVLIWGNGVIARMYSKLWGRENVEVVNMGSIRHRNHTSNLIRAKLKMIRESSDVLSIHADLPNENMQAIEEVIAIRGKGLVIQAHGGVAPGFRPVPGVDVHTCRAWNTAGLQPARFAEITNPTGRGEIFVVGNRGASAPLFNEAAFILNQDSEYDDFIDYIPTFEAVIPRIIDTMPKKYSQPHLSRRLVFSPR